MLETWNNLLGGFATAGTPINLLWALAGCALCFTLAVRGLRISEGKPAGDAMRTVKDVVIGMLIAAPTFWLFTKFLAVNLPGLTGTGWL